VKVNRHITSIFRAEVSQARNQHEVGCELWYIPSKCWLTFTDYIPLYPRRQIYFIATAVRTSNPTYKIGHIISSIYHFTYMFLA
jgi:hypothetical protein